MMNPTYTSDTVSVQLSFLSPLFTRGVSTTEHFPRDATWLDIRKKIAAEFGVPLEETNLWFSGEQLKLLDDARTLQEGGSDTLTDIYCTHTPRSRYSILRIKVGGFEISKPDFFESFSLKDTTWLALKKRIAINYNLSLDDIKLIYFGGEPDDTKLIPPSINNESYIYAVKKISPVAEVKKSLEGRASQLGFFSSAEASSASSSSPYQSISEREYSFVKLYPEEMTYVEEKAKEMGFSSASSLWEMLDNEERDELISSHQAEVAAQYLSSHDT